MGGYDTLEEFFSIVVTKIYTSEAEGMRAKLRADHPGYSKLKNIKSFVKDNLQGFARDQSRKSGMQALAEFNPIREFLRQPVAATRG